MKTHLSLDWPVQWPLVEYKVRQVPHYAGDVILTQERLDTDLLKPLCLFIRTYRLAEVRKLVVQFDRQAIPLFEPIQITLGDGTQRLIPPPIVEEHNGQYVIIDGLHRVYEARETKRGAISVIVARGSLEKLPADVLTWEEVSVTGQRLPRAAKFRGLDETRFRDINRYIDDC